MVELPEGYSRNKIQCPACGVICPVPEGAAAAPRKAKPAEAAPRPRKEREETPPPPTRRTPARTREEERVPAPALEDEAAGWLKDSGPPMPMQKEPLRFEDPPPREESPAPEPVKKPRVQHFPCRRCGRPIRKQRECPHCDGVPEEAGPVPETPAPPTPVGVAPHSMELDESAGPSGVVDPDEDDSPYLLSEKELPTCPKCQKDMVRGAVLCTSCGFNLRTRKKAKQTYEPISRFWITDLTLPQRLLGLAGFQGFHIFLVALTAFLFDTGTAPFFVTWPLMAALACFVLGTYDTISLKRDTRGRTTVTIQWRFFFIPTLPQETQVRGFEGIVMGQWLDAGFLEWFVCASLLPLGLVPSIIWWYLAIHKPFFHVALAQDHGHAEVYVYRGHSAEQMNDIAEAICNAAGLKNVS
jgi:hypothetical protein